MKLTIRILASFLKKNYIFIFLFGLIIGFSERFIGSLQMPYGSVVLNTILILILSIARTVFPQRGTSLLIVSIAVLFKINSIGICNCTNNILFCGPAAMIFTGVFYEIFANIFTTNNFYRYTNFIIVCILTAFVSFSVFALMNTFILKTWDTSRLLQYIFIKGTLTAIASSILSLIGIFFVISFKSENFTRHHPDIANEYLA